MRRVAYVGNWRPAHSTENHVGAAFAELGWKVVRVQEDDVMTRTAWQHRAVPQFCDADLVLYTRTHAWGLHPQTTATWRELEQRGVRTASFHLDLFHGIERERLVYGRDPLFTTGDVFTPDGDPHPWADAGVNHHVLHAGVHRPEARPGVVDPRWAGYDVAFVGSSRAYHREWPYRQQLLGALDSRYGERLLVVPEVGQPAVRGQALNDLYATVPVIVGDSLCLRRTRSSYWSDRPYETLGRGGTLVMPRIDALRDELGHLSTLHSYEWGDWLDLGLTVDALVEQARDDAPRRADAAAAAASWVRDNASYTNRVMEVLDTLGLDYLCPVAMCS